MLSYPACLLFYVLLCLTCFMQYVFLYLMCFVLSTLSYHTSIVPFVLSCITWIVRYVLSCNRCFGPSLMLCMRCSCALRALPLKCSQVWCGSCFVCSHTSRVLCSRSFHASLTLFLTLSCALLPSYTRFTSWLTYSRCLMPIKPSYSPCLQGLVHFSYVPILFLVFYHLAGFYQPVEMVLSVCV